MNLNIFNNFTTKIALVSSICLKKRKMGVERLKLEVKGLSVPDIG